MAGRGPLQAEVILGLDNATTKQLLPHPVDGHARREGVAGIDQPAGEVQAVGSVRQHRQWREHAGDGGFDLGSVSQEVAANVNAGAAGLAPLPHDERGGELRQLLDPADNLFQFGKRLAGLGLLAIVRSEVFAVLLTAHHGRKVEGIQHFHGKLLAGLFRDGLFPGGDRLFELGLPGRELLLQLGNLGLQLIAPLRQLLGQLLGGGDFEPGFVGVVQEGVELVVLALRNGVVLVFVALGTANGQSQEDLPRGIHPVDHRLDAKLLGVGPSLFVHQRVAVKAGGNLLRLCRPGQHVARQLLDGELIERQVAIQRLDHPLSVEPDRAGSVAGEAVRIGVAGQVEPVPAPALAKVRRLQQAVDQSLVGVRGGVFDKRGDLTGAGGKTQQVEAQPPNLRDAIGLGGGGQLLGPQPRENELIERIPHRGPRGDLWGNAATDGAERPMAGTGIGGGRDRGHRGVGRRTLCSFGQPSPDEGEFIGRRAGIFGGGHRRDPLGTTQHLPEQGGGVGGGCEEGATVSPGGQPGGGVDPQAPAGPFRSMALLAIAAEQRGDFAGEINRGRVRGTGGRAQPGPREPQHGQPQHGREAHGETPKTGTETALQPTPGGGQNRPGDISQILPGLSGADHLELPLTPSANSEKTRLPSGGRSRPPPPFRSSLPCFRLRCW